MDAFVFGQELAALDRYSCPRVTPQEFALAWHRLLFDQDIVRAWQLMTGDFRRVVAHVALGQEKARGVDIDETAEALSQAVPASDDMHEFLDAAHTILRNACVVSPDSVGAGATTCLEAPAYEVVRLYVLEDLFLDPLGTRHLAPGESARALTLITTSHGNGSWRMAGIGRIMAPAWPPTVFWEPPTEV